MSSINILESLWTISSIKISREWMDAQSCIWMCLCNHSKLIIITELLQSSLQIITDLLQLESSLQKLQTCYKVYYKLLLTSLQSIYNICK